MGELFLQNSGDQRRGIACSCLELGSRHCERSEAIHLAAQKEEWIALSRSLSLGAHSRDPLAPPNDGLKTRHTRSRHRPA
jgi:hypothetical protein